MICAANSTTSNPATPRNATGRRCDTDPVKAVINVERYPMAVSQVAQTSLRAVIGRADPDTSLSDRDRINAELESVIDGPTEEPWGPHIERVEVKDVASPETMMRSISRQAEAERGRRARGIAADGEFQASAELAEAAPRTLRSV
ncbi:SPFH domain-containing protein [Nocardia mangyaensis]|uniref:SPFH domain-containing protein n=1 Tax=Nocardia mangyaensis TaxID=2213200 RepID=UPI0012EC3F98